MKTLLPIIFVLNTVQLLGSTIADNYTGLMWQYNDANHINWNASDSNNTYDANDISPFSKYPQKDSIVQAQFTSRRNKTGSGTNVDTFFYGNEGRVILGMSDIRNANLIFFESLNRYFKKTSQNPPVYSRDASQASNPDTAKAFSITAVFNIDESSIDTALANGRSSDTLPLFRLQVLFKHGKTSSLDPGQSVLPLVPFKLTPSDTNPGWLVLADKTINKKNYDSLDNDWRVPDTLENGLATHSWNFKQLRISLSNLPTELASIESANILNNDSLFRNFGTDNTPAQTAYEGFFC